MMDQRQMTKDQGPMVRMRDYKKITAFQLADQFVLETYRLTKRFPSEERFGLVTQVRRAAISVPANIAEGASRQHKRDYLNFLYIARASLVEAEYLLGLGTRLGYLTRQEFEIVDQIRQNAAKTLYGLISVVEREARLDVNREL